MVFITASYDVGGSREATDEQRLRADLVGGRAAGLVSGKALRD